ncbi:MAG: GTP-binding protein [Candidatus Helarchaeota archaeon]
MSTAEILNQLLHNYIVSTKNVIATAIIDPEGLVIGSQMDQRVVDEEVVGAVSASFGIASERIKREFSVSGHYGAQIETEQGLFLFTQCGNNVLVTLATEDAEASRILPYSYIVAEKAAQILDLDKKDITLEIPDLENMPDTRFTFKLILIGDGGVGKTSLVRQFVEHKFDQDYISTIGVNIMTKTYKLFENVEIKFSIFDVAGQKYFRRVRKNYFRGTQAILFVFDVTRRDSFESIKTWVQECETELGTLKGSSVKCLLVGNKIDLPNREVKIMEGKALGDELGFNYMETSAKDGTNVDKAFGRIATKLAVDNLLV